MADQLAVLCNGWHSGWHQYIMMSLGGGAVSEWVCVTQELNLAINCLLSAVWYEMVAQLTIRSGSHTQLVITECKLCDLALLPLVLHVLSNLLDHLASHFSVFSALVISSTTHSSQSVICFSHLTPPPSSLHNWQGERACAYDWSVAIKNSHLLSQNSTLSTACPTEITLPDLWQE